jgi:[pyruvate, water dikinase]-phosphate phosphotransferase / [pyruvate, water dikinase] kinase
MAKKTSRRGRKTLPKPSRQPAARVPAKPIVHILSDSTGNLARHMITAFITQFPPETFKIHVHNFIRTIDRLESTLSAVGAAGGIVFHAVVSKQFKQQIDAYCRAQSIPCCDLTGSFVDFLSEAAGIEPQANVERLHRTSDAYRDRIKALEFTLEHDDGLGLPTIDQADLVLVGVSRTSKTPTSIYLGQQGYRVANVSLALEVPVPRELLELPPQKVAGLVIDPTTLTEIRTNRNVSWRMSDTRYNDREHVAREVAWSRRLFAERNWQVVDVTDRAIEETAEKIVKMLGLERRVL